MARSLTATRPQAPVKIRTQGPRVVRFIEEHCPIPDGDMIGKKFIVPTFWKQRIYELFELKAPVCSLCGEESAFEARGEKAQDGYLCLTCTGLLAALPPDERRYSEALIGIAKKNIKSSIMAALGLYFLVADDDPAALVVAAAGSEKQSANLVFGAARTMCRLSPTLSKVTAPFEREIQVPSKMRARMQNYAASVGTNDGPNIKVVLGDELHEWERQHGRDQYTVLSGGLGARFNSMMLAITTAGHTQDSICFEKYEYGKKVRSGEIDDERFYFHWLEMSEEQDHRDPKVWAMVNPLMGISVRESYLADRCKRLPEGTFRRYHGNQWTSGEDIWIAFGAWDRCFEPALDLDPRLPLYVGIDIAKSIDSSAVDMAQKLDMRPISCPLCGEPGVTFTRDTDREIKPGEDIEIEYICSVCGDTLTDPPPDVRYPLRARIWENPYPPSHPKHGTWRMNNNEVKALCRELYKKFPVPAAEVDGEIRPGPMFAYDPWRFRAEADELAAEGLTMVEFAQNDSHMTPASQDFYEAIIRGEVAHDGDPALKRHINNVTAEQKARGWRMSKPIGSTRKIDAAIGGGIAVHCAKVTVQPAPRVSAYADGHLPVVIRA